MDGESTPFEALKAAVNRAGSQSAFARLCGVSQTAVWKWLQSSKRLPAEHVLTVEKGTGVSRHLLRPDIYPLDHQASDRSPEWSPLGGTTGLVACNRGTILHRLARRG